MMMEDIYMVLESISELYKFRVYIQCAYMLI